MTWENPSAACDLAHINPDGKVSDLGYAKTVVDWIYSNPDLFDTERIYVEGFSQNGGYAGFIMVCLSERITGGWGPGAGECGMKKRDRGQWPCYSEKGPLIMCKGVYLNNYKYENQTDGYDCLIKEGHDPRIFEFRPQDGTIEGKHYNIENRLHWAAGCWGLTPFCSKACEATFFDCMDSTGTSTEKIRTQSFRTCIMELEDKPECIECSPTLDMLREGQKPTYEQFRPGHFGAIDPTENHARDNFPESHCDQRDAPKIFN